MKNPASHEVGFLISSVILKGEALKNPVKF